MKYACSRKLYAVQYFEFLRKAQLLDGKLSIAKVARTRTLTRQSHCAMHIPMRMSRAQLSSAIGTHLRAPVCHAIARGLALPCAHATPPAQTRMHSGHACVPPHRAVLAGRSKVCVTGDVCLRDIEFRAERDRLERLGL